MIEKSKQTIISNQMVFLGIEIKRFTIWMKSGIFDVNVQYNMKLETMMLILLCKTCYDPIMVEQV